MTISHFVFFESASAAGDSNVMSVPEGAEDIVIQVTGAGTLNITVKGKTDLQGDWEDVSSISMDSFKVASSITEAGIYTVPLRGLVQMKVINSGSSGIKVYGRIMK